VNSVVEKLDTPEAAGQLGCLSVSENDFKQAMQRLAAAVCVVTSATPTRRAGMTATAVTSLSVDPPSLIVCIQRSARTFDVVSAGRRLCVNVLAESQQDVSNIFASSKGDPDAKFEQAGQWTLSDTEQPMLDGALVNCVCEVERWMVTKTHYVVVGRVVQIRTRDEDRPLIYFNRNYVSVAKEEMV